ncbi:MAG: hypothetical protein H5U40_07750 [Polyangiaceae bacterium]|nr:hypothetical protein [Polyangiaceae bacterium]
MRDSAAFELVSHERIVPGTLLTAAESEQLLAAVRVAYAEASDLDSALDSVDQSEVNQLVLRELDSGRDFVAYEYGAGDNSYGAVFAGDAPAIVAEIHDGDLYECTVYGTPRGAREGSQCGDGWGATCDDGLVCVDYDEELGAGHCAR